MKKVYISVYNKEGIVDFAKDLYKKFDYEIISCGDTYDYLKANEIPVLDLKKLYVDNQVYVDINFEEFVKDSFDMVVVNLKPLSKISSQTDDINKFLAEVNIDDYNILHTAAKFYDEIAVVTSNTDFYGAINTTSDKRLNLSTKVFEYLSDYDGLLSVKLKEYAGEQARKLFSFEKISELKYGANPHQKATIYKSDKMVDYEVINEKVLSYNDILNLTTAANLMSEFYDIPAAAVVKHSVPCGAALGRDIYEAYTKAFDCDPFAMFFGTVAFSKTVNFEVAKHLGSMSVKLILAPDYEEKALDLLKETTNAKIVKLITPLKDYKKFTQEEINVTPFGTLVQENNRSELDKDLFKVVTKTKPTAEQIEDAIFAWKIAKYSRTNAVVVAQDFKTSAIAQGQTSAVAAVEIAMDTACDNSKGSVLASDEALQGAEAVNAAAQGRVSLIIQPGGSIRDREVIAAADKFNIAMVFTGIRNLRF